MCMETNNSTDQDEANFAGNGLKKSKRNRFNFHIRSFGVNAKIRHVMPGVFRVVDFDNVIVCVL